MNSWSNDYHDRLEIIRHKIPISDFRFYNLEHLTLIANKTEEFSKECQSCKMNIQVLNDLADMLPECLRSPDTGRTFEKKKYQIEKHLARDHNIRYINFYYSYFSFMGILLGMLAGIAFSLIITGKVNFSYLLIPGILGLLSGQIIGKRIDRKKYRNKRQI